MFAIYLDVCAQDQVQRNQTHDPELLLAAMASRALVLWYLLQEKANKIYLTVVEAANIAENGWTYLRTVTALARFASLNGILRWKILPKHHVAS